MGSALAVKFSQKYNVCLYINSPKSIYYSKHMVLFNEEENTQIYGEICEITESLEVAIKGAEWIFITFPSFMFDNFSKRLITLLSKKQHLVFIPGSGAAELFFKEVLEKGCTITGLQRVHSVTRVVEPGKLVRESGVRKSIRVASIPQSFNNEACYAISCLFDLPVDPLENYLNITLINSNPILHTSRLFSIFKDYPQISDYSSLPLFYEQWDLESSLLLEKMDSELFSIIDALKQHGIPVNNITSILQHYDSINATEMTQKLNSINSLKGLQTPAVRKANGKYIPDFQSRYFTADFPLGLDVLLSFASILNIQCPNMKMVSDWYHTSTNAVVRFSLNSFGINNIDKLKEFYSQ